MPKDWCVIRRWVLDPADKALQVTIPLSSTTVLTPVDVAVGIDTLAN